MGAFLVSQLNRTTQNNPSILVSEHDDQKDNPMLRDENHRVRFKRDTTKGRGHSKLQVINDSFYLFGTVLRGLGINIAMCPP